MISVDVANTGGTPGTYMAELSIENELVDSENVTLNPDESGTVSFDVSKKEAGTYDFSVEGLTGSFEVEKPAKLPIVPIVVAVVIIAVAIGAIWYLRKVGSPGGI